MNAMDIFKEVYETRSKLMQEFHSFPLFGAQRSVAYEYGMEQALKRVNEICAGTRHDIETVRDMYNLYTVMCDRGNERIDFECMDRSLVESFITFMRENEILEFTCSAENSATEIAMWFKNAGCRLVDVVSIHGKVRYNMPAFLFEVN